MHPSVRCFWAVCLPSATATSVQTSTSSNVATRPVAVEATVCARHWPTMPTSAPNTESTLTSGHRSLSAVSDSLPAGFIKIVWGLKWIEVEFKLVSSLSQDVVVWASVCVYTGVVCLGGMLYHSCVSSCGRSCRALSGTEVCNADDCAEGCGCPHGSYYDDVRQRCVQL